MNRLKQFKIGIILTLSVFALSACSDGGTESSIGDHTIGNLNSEIVLLEYSDFQCPACASYHPTIQRLMEEFEDDIQFTYRHFPLGQHEHANLAARSAEAAGLQGKFWEMHDMIFDNQSTWSDETNAKESFLGYAESLGLDLAQFEQDLNSTDVKNKVNRDRQDGNRAEVNATPTFYLNGTKVSGISSYEDFQGLIQSVVSNN